jgi:hypothetical protein
MRRSKRNGKRPEWFRVEERECALHGWDPYILFMDPWSSEGSIQETVLSESRNF